MLFQPFWAILHEHWDGFLHLLYPRLCVACEGDLPAGPGCFCFSCRLRLDLTDMHLHKENAFTERIWGRLPVEGAAAYCYFTRKSPIQRALHLLKYHDRPEIGVKLGREFGRTLAQSEVFRSVEVVVPVPLHPRKERLRGYNQSAFFAEGLAEMLDVRCIPDALERRVFAHSQTRKKRLERFENVEENFCVTRPASLQNKHVLLVDDVLTTGATLEACGRPILELPGTRLSLATIAIAVQHSS